MAFNDPDIEKRARPKRTYLEKNQADYQRAKGWIEKYGEHDRDHLLGDLIVLLESYRPSDPPHAAVYVVGQMRQMVADAHFYRNIVREYETKQEELRGLSAQDLEISGQDPT